MLQAQSAAMIFRPATIDDSAPSPSSGVPPSGGIGQHRAVKILEDSLGTGHPDGVTVRGNVEALLTAMRK